jgi:hypothetical protein
MSIVVSFLLIFGLDNAFNFDAIFTSMGRFSNIFGYFAQITHPGSLIRVSPVPVTFEQFTGSIVFPLLTAVVVLGLVFVYFTRKMEVD